MFVLTVISSQQPAGQALGARFWTAPSSLISRPAISVDAIGEPSKESKARPKANSTYGGFGVGIARLSTSTQDRAFLPCPLSTTLRVTGRGAPATRTISTKKSGAAAKPMTAPDGWLSTFPIPPPTGFWKSVLRPDTSSRNSVHEGSWRRGWISRDPWFDSPIKEHRTRSL